MPSRLTPLDFQTPAVESKTFTFTDRWKELMRLLFGDVATVLGSESIITSQTIAQVNALGLGSGDEGALYRLSDGFGHLVRWSGSVWEWGPGDPGNGYRQDFFITPDATRWAPCDGNNTTYLTGIGTTTLAATTFATPNITAGTFPASGAYTGSVVAAVAPGVSGSTANATAAVSGTVTVDPPDTALDFNGVGVAEDVAGASVVSAFKIGGLGVPSTNIGSFSASHSLQADSHGHGLGTIAADTAARPPSLAAPWYLRR